MSRWTDWWDDPYAPREGDKPVLVAKSSEAERGHVSSVEAAEEGIARLVAKTDSRIVHPAFYVTRDQRRADLIADLEQAAKDYEAIPRHLRPIVTHEDALFAGTNWPWTEREDDDENSDAETSLPVRETV